MKKIVHIGYFHSAADVRILEKECATLNKTQRYNVYYYTSNRNSESGSVVVEGITVVVLPVGKKRGVRLFQYLIKIKNEVLTINPDICHIHEFVLFPLVGLLKKRNIKVIIDLHEDHPVDYANTIKNKFGTFAGKFTYGILRRYEKKVIKMADGVIAVTPKFACNTMKYNDNTLVLPNYPILDGNIVQRNISEFSSNSTKVAFAGVVSPIWNHEKVLDAIREMSDVRYNLAGRADVSYLDRMKKHKAWKNVNYFGVIPFDDVKNKIYAKSTIGVALLSYDSVSGIGKEGTMGNTKIFEFMYSGIPVICTDFLLWKEIVADNNCGIVVNPSNPKEIENAILWLKQNPQIAYQMGVNGQNAISSKYNWNILGEKLVEMYEHMLF